MRRAAPAAAVVLAAVLAITACSSTHASSTGYSVARLERLLLTAAEAALPDYTLTSADGEAAKDGTTFANEFLNDTAAQSQVDVSLLSAPSPAAARAATTARLKIVGQSLRDGGQRTAVAVGTGGTAYSGRAKLGGSIQTSVYFSRGRISAQVVFVGVTQSLTSADVERLARAQDAKLRTAA